MSRAAWRSNLQQIAALAAGGVMTARYATVSTPHNKEHAVKVLLQPSGIESNYLPVLTPFVGNGWGMFCKPDKGDQVLVVYAEGDINCGVVVGGIFSDVDRPLPAPAGEFWMVHKAGAFLKFLNDGTVSLSASAGLNITAPTTITGTLRVTQDVTLDTKLTAATDVIGGGKSLKTHTHTGVTTGGGTSGPPT